LQADNNQSTTDAELWQQLKHGNKSALEVLYKRHYQVLYRYAIKLAKEKEPAQDCLQEMFFQLWNKREKLKDVQSVRFYLMKWLKREVIRALNDKSKGSNIISMDTDTEHLSLMVEDLFEKKEMKSHNAQALRKALDELTTREREVIYMRFFLELTYEEICSAMNLSYQVVMNYVHRALKALRASNLINKIISMTAMVESLTSGLF
jgi:RNA polymerase sigma factor (sigma-70 family)